MQLNELIKEYDKMQLSYGEKNLKSINFGGCTHNPDICFVFMNPTKKNIAANPLWKGDRSPWLGTKNIWNLFVATKLFDNNLYDKIKAKKPSDWDEEFASKVYEEVSKNKLFITNLGKCTQADARELPDFVYEKYLSLLEQEIEIINPKVVILFGNQVSSVFLKEKICVSQCRKKEFTKVINGKNYKCFSVFYPVGNGRFNIDKSIEDIIWIKNYIINENYEE